jgi:type IV pilus assembly protein PilE
MIRRERKFRIRGSVLTTGLVLLATTALLAVGAKLSLSSYRHYAMEVSRTDAQRELQEAARRLQRCLAHGSDETVTDKGAGSCETFPQTTPEDTYVITGHIEGSAFRLTATPVAGQAQDSECGALTLDDAGRKGNTGAADNETCWTADGD